MHSNLNNDNYNPKSISIVDEMCARDMIVNMAKSGESNITFMIEVVLSNYPHMKRSTAHLITLEAIMHAQRN